MILPNSAAPSGSVEPLRVDSANSTTTPLAGGASFTGTWIDAVAQSVSSIVIGAATDAGVAGQVSLQFSRDGVTVHGTAGPWVFGSSGSIGVPKAAIATARYYRVLVENTDADPQTVLGVQTLISPSARVVVPTSRVAQGQTDYSDCLSVRELTDVHLDETRGLHGGRTVIHKFGRNPNVASNTQEDVWLGGGLYTGWLQTASALRIRSGGNANDTAAGSGARSITIEGLDENWELASETVATAGTSASAATTTTFIRVFRAYVATSGTYGGGNAADVSIETTGGTLVALMGRVGASTNDTGLAQTQLCMYTIPTGKIGFIRSLEETVESAKAASIFWWQRQNADDTSAPVTAPRVFRVTTNLSGTRPFTPVAPFGPFPARTDIWVSAVGPSGGSAVAAEFELVLVDAV